MPNGEKIKIRREKLGWSQFDLTDRCPSLSRFNLSMIENGRREPKEEEGKEIETALKKGEKEHGSRNR